MTIWKTAVSEVLLWLIDIGLAACGHDYKTERAISAIALTKRRKIK